MPKKRTPLAAVPPVGSAPAVVKVPPVETAPPAERVATGLLGWEGFHDGVVRERMLMLGEFHHWLVKRRIEIEKELLNCERGMVDLAPFAQAGVDGAAAPEEVPLCVIEFAKFSLRVLYLRRKLDLLNVYYRQAVTDKSDAWLIAEKSDDAQINELWEWFIHERNNKGD